MTADPQGGNPRRIKIHRCLRRKSAARHRAHALLSISWRLKTFLSEYWVAGAQPALVGQNIPTPAGRLNKYRLRAAMRRAAYGAKVLSKKTVHRKVTDSISVFLYLLPADSGGGRIPSKNLNTSKPVITDATCRKSAGWRSGTPWFCHASLVYIPCPDR